VPLALATLVRVQGSSYRQPGARLLVDAEGRVLAGAVSGGCLEGDVAARAEAVCARGEPATLVYDLRDDLQAIWGFGSACDGIATLVLEPLPTTMRDGGWLAHADRARVSRHGGAVVTHVARHVAPQMISNGGAGVDAQGDAPGAVSLGTIAVVDGDSMHGLTPFDAAWHDVIRRGADIATRTAHVGVEAVDGGTLFIEPLVPPVALSVIGAGRGAEAFARIGTTLGWDVTVIDHRPALLDALVLPPSTRVVRARGDDPSEALASVAVDARSAVALLTHIFDTDLAWLTGLMRTGVPYIGVLGSRQRAAKLVGHLRSDGMAVTPAMLQRLHAPIGLDLGGESPESIALAAVAEIEAVMHGRPGGSLRQRQSPIHERTPVPRRADEDSVPENSSGISAISAIDCALPTRRE
jgi:xanthine/CO dehydrogenase XdhC/CoxF family maturation factor